MSTTRRTTDLFDPQMDAVIAAHNEMCQSLADHGLMPHHAPTTKITDTGTADLAAVQVIANAAKAAFNAHLADTGAHPAADATNPVATAAATDQTTSNNLLNALKSAFNAHVILRASHRAAPAYAELAKDLETLKASYDATLAKIDVLTAKLNADAGVTDTNYATNFAATNPSVAAVNPGIIKTPDASDLATSKTLAAAIVIAFNRHFGAGASLITVTGS